MTLNIHKASAWILAIIIAATLSLAMGFTSQTVFAEDGADDYEMELKLPNSSTWQLLHNSTNPVTVELTQNEQPAALPEGASIEWKTNITEEDVRNKLPADFLTVAQNPDNQLEATLTIKELPEDLDSVEIAVIASMKINGEIICSNNYGFMSVFRDYYEVQWPETGIDPYMAVGEETTVSVNVIHHTVTSPEGEPADYDANWFEYDKVMDIEKGEKAADGSITFNLKRKSIKEGGDMILEITTADGWSDRMWYPMEAFSENLSDYTIGISEEAEYSERGESVAIYFIDDEGKATASVPAEDLCFVSDGRTVPYDPDQYELTVKKYLGEDENTGDPKYSAASFPLSIDGKNTKDINGIRTDGTAIYVVTAKAKDGSVLKGELTDALVLQSKYTLCGYGSYVDFSDLSKYWKEIDDDPYWRFEVPKGVTSKGPVITMDEKKLANTNFTIAYINDSTKKSVTSFPKTAGTYTVKVTGKAPYYGEDTSVHIKVGLKNTIKVKGKTLTVKAKAKKTKKKKTYKRAKAISVKKAKGSVTYKKVKGNKKITVASNGKVTVKKGLKRGTYKVKVSVTAAGNNQYFPLTKKVTFKVRVR